jgi:hypothetical protein
VLTRFSNCAHRQWLISLLLVAVVVRALIPAGFMPAADRPFTLEICPDGFPAQLLHHDEHAAHHHHAQTDSGSPNAEKGSQEHGAARAEHCVFAAAAGVGPAPQIALLLAPIETGAAPLFTLTSRTPALTRHRVQQPRAPPTLS